MMEMDPPCSNNSVTGLSVIMASVGICLRTTGRTTRKPRSHSQTNVSNGLNNSANVSISITRFPQITRLRSPRKDGTTAGYIVTLAPKSLNVNLRSTLIRKCASCCHCHMFSTVTHIGLPLSQIRSSDFV